MRSARALDVALVEQSDVSPFVPGNGLVLRLAYGPFIRPLSWMRWRGFNAGRPGWWPFYFPNPWSQWRWATVRLPFIILPFLSFRIYRRDGSYLGLYLGGKVYFLGDDAAWGHTYARPEEIGRQFVTLSATFRWRHGG